MIASVIGALFRCGNTGTVLAIASPDIDKGWWVLVHSSVAEVVAVFGEFDGVVGQPVMDDFKGNGLGIVNGDGGDAVTAIFELNIVGLLGGAEAFVGQVKDRFVEGSGVG